MKNLGSVFSLLSNKYGAGQGLFDGGQVNLGPSIAIGWAGFLDVRFMLDSIGVLLLAAMLGAMIGFHPATRRTIDGLHEADMPHVYVMYAVIGAVIGVAVREFGMVVGVVVFGIGGLARFRSTTDSTRDTVRLILVTLIGLITGLGLLHFAVITSLLAFGLIYVFDSNPICRIRIEGMPMDRFSESAELYRKLLNDRHCKIIAEHRSLSKGRIEFIFRLRNGSARNELELAVRSVSADLRGNVDWEMS